MKITLSCKLLIAYIILAIISCRKPPLRCDSFGPSIEIKFINQQGQNLIFGTTSQYRFDSVRFLYEKGNYNSLFASSQKGSKDTNNIAFTFFYAPSPKVYIYYNSQTPQDSIEMVWGLKTARCERGDTIQHLAIDSAKFNNVLIKPVNGVYTFVK